MNLIDYHKFSSIIDDELFTAVILEMLRDQGMEISPENDGYDIEGKTEEEIEALKQAAKWIAKYGGPEFGICRTDEDLKKVFGKK